MRVRAQKITRGGLLTRPVIPSILTGPVHPFGSLAALSVPPRNGESPLLRRSDSHKNCGPVVRRSVAVSTVSRTHIPRTHTVREANRSAEKMPKMLGFMNDLKTTTGR